MVEINGLIILFTLLGSIASLAGIFLLLQRHAFAQKVSLVLVSLAAGTLLATALLDLLPEALEHNEKTGGMVDVPLFILFGMVLFFFIERFLLWFHHHHEEEEHAHPSTTLVLLGDGVHNFIDGIVIAASFFVSIPLGIVTALAVVVHEVPQEIGDMAVLLHGGMAKNKAVLFNFLTALTSVAGAVLAISFRESIEGLLPIFLSLTAGFFIYIAASDLIPQLHKSQLTKRGTWMQTLFFLGGIGIVYILNSFLTHG